MGETDHRAETRITVVPATADCWADVQTLLGGDGDLLEGAIAYARASGAPAVEAYPIDPGGRRVDTTFGYVGFVSMFEAAGFRRVMETNARSDNRPRILVRLHFDR